MDAMTPQTTAWSLVVLFGIHLGAFAWLSLAKRTWRYWSTLVAFLLLVALNLLNALGVDATVGDVAMQAILRWSALGFLAITVIRLVRKRRRNRAN